MSHQAFRVALTLFVSAVVVARCGNRPPTEPTPTCTPTLAPVSASYGSDGGTGSVTLSVASGCAWTATASGAWIALSSGAAGSGPGSVAYTVAANSAEASRSGAVSIAGLTHAVSQQGRPATPCTFELSPTTGQIGKDAATGTFAVNAPSGCAWSASSNASWLTISGNSTGSGNGTVTYAASRNLGAADRAAVVTVADRAFTLSQSGDLGVCGYSVAPVNVNACMPGGSFTAMVTTQADCPWTAAVDASWLAIRTGASGSGSGLITVEYPDNYDAPRAGTVLVRWPTLTQGQNVHLSQAGCRYAVTKTTVALPAGGGTGSFDVLQQSDPTSCGGATQDRCLWTAVASEPWIIVTGSMPRSGDSPVAFSVGPNPSSTPRSGTITVRDKTVLVTQAGQ